jgi:mitochondrial inner membrane protease ATP23
MSASGPSDGKNIPRTLNPRDQRIFEHWRETFTSPSLYSVVDNASQSSPTAPSNSDEDLSPGQKDKKHKGCVSLVNRLFEKSPIIIFMNSELKKVSCSPPVYCAPCREPGYGGFNADMGILICENHVHSKRRLESTLAHEMIHAFDHCRFKFDYNNLKHVACGEVGPCTFLNVGSGSCVIEGMQISE